MQMPQPNTVFQTKYQLDSVLGEGGFATVYRATDMGARRTVAIKVLRPEAMGYSAGAESRFMREVRVIANLRDPHTVTMFDFGRTPEGLLFMVFEYVPGRDLADYMGEVGTFDEAAAVHVLRQILESLREAHTAGLLHRDIKPENIRVYTYMGDSLRVKVLDFGIARAAQEHERGITKQGAVVGTPGYMSPEQLVGAELGPSSDIFSVGLVAYEMVQGRGVIEALAQPGHMLKRLARREPVTFPVDARVSGRFRGVVERMLMLDAADRFQNAEAVLRALDGERPTADDYGLDSTERLPAAAATFVEEDSRTAPLPAVTAVEAAVTPVPPAFTTGPMARATLPALGPTQEAPAETPDSPWVRVAWIAVGTCFVLLCLAAVGLVARRQTESIQGDPLTVEKEDLPPMVLPDPPEPVHTTPAVPRSAARDAGPDVSDARVDTGPKVIEGCGKEPPMLGAGELSIVSGLTRREWWAYIPKSYKSERQHRVLLLFHDNWQTLEEFVAQAKLADLAEREKLVILGLRGRRADAYSDREAQSTIAEIVDLSASMLCLDTESLFAIGNGAGGRVVEELPCILDGLRGIATISYRSTKKDAVCEPDRPVPYIHLFGREDGANPLDGGHGCTHLEKISIDEKLSKWRERNQCTDKVRRTHKSKQGICREWSCGESPFAVCALNSGRIYHVAAPQLPVPGFDSNCLGRPSKFPVSKTIWKFFEDNAK